MKSGYRYTFKGVNTERFLNKMSADFELFDIKKDGTKGQFCISLSKDKKLCKQMKNFDIQIEQKQGFGILYHLLCLVKRYGIMTALLLSVAFFVVCSNFVFGIKVMGIESISQTEVIQILKQNGFEKVNKKSDIDTSKFEKDLSSNLKNISLVSIIIKGNTLVVSIKEKVQNSEYENKDNFEPIVSNFDGVLTKVQLVQGMLNKKVGDIIKKGDVLVFPYIVDASGNQRKVEPKAEIYAKVYITQKASFYDVEMIAKRTGKSMIKTDISAFGLKIFSDHKECEFALYETESTKKTISNGNIFPITLEKTTFYEIQNERIENDFEQKKQQIMDDLKQKTLKNLQECDIIENERQNVTRIAGKNELEYVLEIQKRII